jgi:hypothetical protein
MKIIYSIIYAGLQLPILKNDQGQDVTPLKPISDLFGLQWERQRKKVANGEYLGRYLGFCTVPLYGAGGQKSSESDTCAPTSGGAGSQIRGQTCILLSRVAAFLMSINPEMVRAKGNVSGADYLIAKQEEWADALHAYEDVGVAFKTRNKESRADLQGWFKTRLLAETPQEKAAIARLIKEGFADIGQPFEEDSQKELDLT